MATKESLESKRREMVKSYLECGTVRKAEKITGYSKTCIHSAARYYIEHGGYEHVDELKALISKNKAERHIRGGEATKRKHEILRTIREFCAIKSL